MRGGGYTNPPNREAAGLPQGVSGLTVSLSPDPKAVPFVRPMRYRKIASRLSGPRLYCCHSGFLPPRSSASWVSSPGFVAPHLLLADAFRHPHFFNRGPY